MDSKFLYFIRAKKSSILFVLSYNSQCQNEKVDFEILIVFQKKFLNLKKMLIFDLISLKLTYKQPTQYCHDHRQLFY
jgi:hypothetical protein